MLVGNHKDAHAARAKLLGYRARSALKLIEINQKERLFRPRLSILDLGAAPGSWSQVCAKMSPESTIVAVDLKPINHIEGVRTLVCDVTKQEAVAQIASMLPNGKADLVISDAAPMLSGDRMVDQKNALEIWERIDDLVQILLKPAGTALIKLFQGQLAPAFDRSWRAKFSTTKVHRPKACRKSTTEYYLLSRKPLQLS